MANSVIQLVRNDTEPQVELTLSDDSGPIDLTGKTVNVYIRRNAREGVLLTRQAITFSASEADGKAFLVWNAGDLDLERGSYEAEVEIEGSGGFRQTVFETLQIEVREDFA